MAPSFDTYDESQFIYLGIIVDNRFSGGLTHLKDLFTKYKTKVSKLVIKISTKKFCSSNLFIFYVVFGKKLKKYISTWILKKHFKFVG